MSLIVQKFGGSSVADAERVFNVAGIVTDTYKKGNDVVVVVSAQGDTTDEFIEKARQVNPNPSKCCLPAENKFRSRCWRWPLRNWDTQLCLCWAGRLALTPAQHMAVLELSE